jgi:cell division protein FtsQ
VGTSAPRSVIQGAPILGPPSPSLNDTGGHGVPDPAGPDPQPAITAQPTTNFCQRRPPAPTENRGRDAELRAPGMLTIFACKGRTAGGAEQRSVHPGQPSGMTQKFGSRPRAGDRGRVLGAERSASIDGRLAGAPPDRQRGGLFGRTRNQRVKIQRRPPVVAVADALTGVGRRLLVVLRVVGKIVLALAITAAIFLGGRLAVRHVIASPRFAVKEIQVTIAAHVSRDEVLDLAGVDEGDRLLAIDTDPLAARVASHPWVKSARVRRQLPSTLIIDLVERRAAAAVAMGGLYLVDETGHPFKKATMEEADGLPVLTGIDRAWYAEKKEAGEAAFREGLGLLADYGARPGRPAPSELNIDPRFGFSLFLLDGGAEIRLGRGDFSKKLARLDQIFEAVKVSPGLGALRVVHLDHLDGTDGSRVTVGLLQAQGQDNKKD